MSDTHLKHPGCNNPQCEWHYGIKNHTTNYGLEKQLVEEALNGRWNAVRHLLQQLTPQQLNRLTDTGDKLAAKVDEEAIRRVEKRR